MTLEEQVDKMFARADQPTGTPFITNSVFGLHLTEAGWRHAATFQFKGMIGDARISEGPTGVFEVSVLGLSGRLIGTFTVRAIRDEEFIADLREAA